MKKNEIRERRTALVEAHQNNESRKPAAPADPAADTFPELFGQLHLEAIRQKDEKAFFISHGYLQSWAEEHRKESDTGLERYSTPLRWKQYNAGTITREQAVLYAVSRSARQVDKWTHQQESKLRTAAAAPALRELSVGVEWRKSSTWGNNPTATAHASDGVYTGTASGCGYDKESAAVADALNQSPAVMRVLYQAAEDALRDGEKVPRFDNGVVHWGDVLGYGAGYAVLPYFEGGVGVSCFWNIFKRCGFSAGWVAGGRTFDSYIVQREQIEKEVG